MAAATATARAPEQRSDQHTPEVRFEARTRTLRGDIRDLILREFKGLSQPWQKMTEAEQSRVIHTVDPATGEVTTTGEVFADDQIDEPMADGESVTSPPSPDEPSEDERLEAAIGEAEPVTPPSPPSAPAVDFEPDDEAAVMRRRQAVRPDAQPAEEPRADEDHLAKVGRGGGRRRKADEPAAQT